jgi:hypothetical protein
VSRTIVTAIAIVTTSGVATPTPATAAPSVGLYVGNDPRALRSAERWLGRRVDAVQLFVGSASWEDWSGSLGWLANEYRLVSAQRLWSLPLIPVSANLEAAAAGEYNQRYVAQAQQFVSLHPRSGQIYLRVGWEFNGDGWNAWSAVGKPAAYAGAFRQLVNSFRSVSDRFRFEWTPNVGEVGMDPELAYPGDGYVDVIGMDFYYDAKYDSRDPEVAWQSFVIRKWGLKWHQDFAAARCKPTAYPEWGINLDASAPFIARARAWFNSYPVLYHSYWNSDAAFRGKLSGGAMPETGRAFRAAFGGRHVAGGPRTFVVQARTAACKA